MKEKEVYDFALKINKHCIEQQEKYNTGAESCDECELKYVCRETWAGEIMPMYWFKPE